MKEELVLALELKLKAKILNFAGNSSAINEFSLALCLSPAPAHSVYVFRLISYQI